MAIRRMILSNIWDDEFVGNLSFFERLLWIGLFSRCADDQGRLLDNALVIRAQVFPYDNVAADDIEQALARFADAGKITRYAVNGRRLIQLVRWWTNQKPQWAYESKFPGPPGWTDHVRTKEQSGKTTDRTIVYPMHVEPQEASQQGPQKGPQQATHEAAQERASLVQFSGSCSLASGLDPECEPALAPIVVEWPDLNALAGPAGPACPLDTPSAPRSTENELPPKGPPTAAVREYDRLSKTRANAAQRTLIEQAERELGSERVIQAMTEWFERGYKRTNVAGMVRVAREGWQSNGQAHRSRASPRADGKDYLRGQYQDLIKH